MLLEVNHISVSYDKAMLLNDVSLNVDSGEMVSLVGPNGAGKSTCLRTITGLVAWEKEITRRSARGEITIEGTITFDGKQIQKTPAHNIVKMGLILCPERRRPFREMSVLDNLYAGAYLLKDKAQIAENLEKVYELFPVLESRSNQISGTLSGGEQQMLALGRALMSTPRLLCIDEPSTGLAPLMRTDVFKRIKSIKEMGITVLLIEQEVNDAFKMTNRNYVLSSGKIVAQGTGEELMKDEVVRQSYLGL